MKLSARNTRVVAVAIAAVLVVVLGGGLLLQVTKSPPVPSASPSAVPTLTPVASASGTAGKTTVVWFIGLGAGTQPNQLQAETDFVNHYNAVNTDNLDLQLEIIHEQGPNPPPFESRLAADEMDIIGPVGIQGRAQYSGNWLGLDDLIAKNKTDLSVYPPAVLNAVKNTAGQHEALPYTQYPAFIFYNKDLFKSAGLPDLPTAAGEKYMGQDWTWDELATIAKLLTVDTSRRKSTDAGFNPARIKTYGFDAQWVNDLRRFATPWGAGSYVAADGKTAQIPPVWEQAWKWYYDAMWTSHFAPTYAEINAADMGTGTTVATGRVAMDLAWDWTINGFGQRDANGYPTSAPSPFKHWDMGVLPSNNGVTTTPGGSGDASAELYDPTNGTFSPTNGSMKAVRFSHTATRLPDGSVLIAGGNPLALAMLMPSFASAELYQP
jgi:multiple sugar transport system substrate-binding protein